jgi:GT2 family glycosyltransferase/glycosyltransferase involved in cell wall biosynthesis
MIKKKVRKRILVEKDAALKHEAPVQEEQKAIIVLGMHRSGTSAVAGVLNILGVDFAPSLVPAQPDNPEGFQQLPDIVNIHDRILESLNLKWDDVGPFPDNWWKNKALRPFRNDLSEIIVRDFAECELWGINDPRMSRLLPLWLSIFHEVNCHPHFVHIVRNPVEVSESLRKRQGFARRKSILLWMVHELEAELWTRNLPRVFVSYRQLLENWPGTLEKISDGLGISFPLKISDVVDKVSDFLDLEMKHHDRAEDLWSYDPDTPQCVLKAYSNFENATDGADKDFVTSLSECRAEFESSMLSYPSRTLMEELKQQRSNAGGELTGLSERIGELEGGLRERDVRLVEASAQLEARTDEIALRDVRISELEQTLSAKDNELQSMTASLQELEDRVTGLGAELARRDKEAETRIAELEANIRNNEYRIFNLQAIIQLRDEQIQNMYGSNSWRMTAPERWIANKVRTTARNYPRLAWPVRRFKRALGISPFRSGTPGINHAIGTDVPTMKASPSHTEKTEPKSEEYKPSGQSAGVCSTGPPVPTVHEWPIDRWKRLTREQIAFQLGRFSENIPELTESIKALQGNGQQVGHQSVPVVSIIIPCYNNVAYTLNCIRSILDHQTRYTYEIITVDDCSTDETPDVLSQIGTIRYLRNEQNSGFIHTCNAGAGASRGEYVLFLNSDTLVLPGWLDELVDTFSNFSDVGLVGSKLLYPDGKLQEAGCIIWNDGSAWNYGRNDDSFKPEYNYAREVDYCSGASIIIPKSLFDELGGFDPTYSPAYCEDSDIALKIRSLGKRVLYQPLSALIHFEGVSCGTDTNTGVKGFQVENTAKCFSRWKKMLSSHGKAGLDPHLERDRDASRRILIIDSTTCTPDQDAGSVTALEFMRIFLSMKCKITFIPVDNYLLAGQYTHNLQKMGVECFYGPYITDVVDHLIALGDKYDVVLLYRVMAGGRFIDHIRRFCPRAYVIFDTVDLHYLRELREAELENDAAKKQAALKTKKSELAIIQKADCTILLSEHERVEIEQEVSSARLVVIPLVLDIPGRHNGFSRRQGICFIGGFRHPPNIDAVIYFCSEVFPLTLHRNPSIIFYVIGSNVPRAILELESDNVKVLGHVPDLADIFETVRLSVVPVRYGAGIKGKIGTSLSYGVPCISSSVGVEGMGCIQDQGVFVADDPDSFAALLCDVYDDEHAWQEASDRGLNFVNNQYSREAGETRLRTLLGKCQQ